MSGRDLHHYTVVVIVVVSYIQRIGRQPEKTTLHGGQSRSWSAEQGKKTTLIAIPGHQTQQKQKAKQYIIKKVVIIYDINTI